MKTYTITRVLTSPDWTGVPALQVDEHLWLPSEQISMTVQICYDAQGFYVHMKAVEPHVRAAYTGPLSMVCQDSCMEWFFAPLEGDSRYLNFEINPNGRTFIGIGSARGDNVRLAPMNEEALFRKKCAVLMTAGRHITPSRYPFCRCSTRTIPCAAELLSVPTAINAVS